MGADFSWKRATFAGFGVLRHEPGALLTWTLVALVFALVDQVLDVNGEILRTAGGAAGYLLLKSLLRGAIIAVGMGVLSAAVYRAVLNPGGEARGHTRFGLGEIRLALLWGLQGAALVVAEVVAIVPLALLSPKSYGYNDVGYWIAIVTTQLLVLLAWGWMLARLALAGPMTIATGRWSGPEAWGLTRGRAWRIAGVHLVVVIGLAAVFAIWNALYGVVATAVVPGFSVSMLQTAASPADLFTPVKLVFTLLNAVLGAAAAAVLYAPAAAIYRDLAPDSSADQVAVFD